MPNTATASAVSDNVPSAEDLLERARALAPAIRERARQTALNGDVPPESVAAIREAGLFRILQPKRYGGYEMHPNTFFDVQKILAEALTGGMAQMYLVVTHACLVTISMAWWRAVSRLPMSALPVPARSSAVP